MTSDSILQIIAKGESQTVELKRSFNNEAIETLVAFSNSKGGMVILGVSDPNSNQLLNTSEVVNMHLLTFNSSWDYHINNQYSIDNISFDKVQQAIDAMNSQGSRITDDPLTFLLKKDLIRGERLTNASFLLFAAGETAMTTIELGRFQTETIIKDSARSKCDILSQVELVIAFVMKHINKEVIITGKPQNTQKWQYPIESIREIVMNMIIHRDYRSSSDSIVKIFDNRIEFYNPGRLPDNISIEDLFTNNYKSTPRNKIIADFCKDLGLIEKYGSGIKRIIEYFAKEKLPIPEFKNISDGFMVTVFSGHENINFGLTNVDLEKGSEKSSEKSSEKIMVLLRRNQNLTIDELSKALKITTRAVEKQLAALKEQGLLKRIGPAKGGHWEVIAENTD